MSRIPLNIQSQIEDVLDQAPVDVRTVADRLGLAIFQRDYNGISGALIRDESYETPSGFVIFVNDSEVYVRQRFTAAHEIGHFVLHKDRVGNGINDNYLLRADGFSNKVEQEANQFAADLLMPYPLIKRLMGAGISSVQELAAELMVSEIAMGVRIGSPT